MISFYDKEEDREIVPEGKKFGLLSVEQEGPHDMSSWIRGPKTDIEHIDKGSRTKVLEEGPSNAKIRHFNNYGRSEIRLDIKVYEGLKKVVFELSLDWKEIGDEKKGVPTLVSEFPVNFNNPKFKYDIPFGNIERKGDGKDVPGQKWACVTDSEEEQGITITNDSSYGFFAENNKLAVTLLRSSYHPDSIPEFRDRKLEYTVYPDLGNWNTSASHRKGIEF